MYINIFQLKIGDKNLRSLLVLFSIMLFSLVVFASTSTSSESRDDTSGHLVIALDGIGFQTFQKMHKGGYFREFVTLAPLVATFPTISGPNWNRLFQVPVTKDFTSDKYFDLDQSHAYGKGRIRGHLLRALQAFSWYKFFDFAPETVLERLFLIGWSVTASQYFMDLFQKDFLKTDQKFYAVYFSVSDYLAHLKGEISVLELLKHLDQTLVQIQRQMIKKHKKPLKITLVSDHGNAYVKPKFIDYKKLTERGWNLSNYLGGPQDIVLVVPEVLSFASLHCQDSKREILAKDIVQLEGVHLSAFSKNRSEIEIFSAKPSDRQTYLEGHVKVHIDEKSETLQYSLISGHDPLGHSKYFQRSKTLTWKEYFHLTLNDQYPYAAVSLWEGFYKNAQQSPSVLVSTDKDYAFANPLLKFVSKLKGRIKSLHGSLDRDQSLAFFASTHTRVEALTPSDFYQLISPPKQRHRQTGLSKEENRK